LYDLDKSNDLDDLEDIEDIPMLRMNDGQNVFDFVPRTKLKLSEIQERIRKHRIIVPCPSKQTLIAMCEDGTFESAGKDANGHPAPTRFGWLVYEDSFFRWARSLDGLEEPEPKKAAA
jgi:hypothetical protein